MSEYALSSSRVTFLPQAICNRLDIGITSLFPDLKKFISIEVMPAAIATVSWLHGMAIQCLLYTATQWGATSSCSVHPRVNHESRAIVFMDSVSDR